MEELQSGIAYLSNETGIAASDLNEALYQTISATGDTANAVDYTGIAAKAAVGGFTDTATAIDGLTTVMNAYGLSGSEAMQKVSDQMLMAQNYGKTTFGEISASIGNVIPLAAQLNVGTDELFASIATLTKQGIGTSEAITGLKAAFSNVIKPTDSAAKKVKQLGLDFSSTALESKGLAGFLADVMEKTGGNTDTMAELFGSVEALNTVLALCSETGQADFVGAMAAMDSSAGATQSAFDTMQQGFSASWERTKNLLTNIGAGIMENVIPMATDAVNSMNGVLAMIGEGEWDGVGQAILGGVSGAIDSAGAWLSGMFMSAKQAVLSIDWSAVGETVKNGTASAIDTAGTWLKGLFETGLTAVQSIDWHALGVSIHDGVCGLIDSAGSWLSGLFSAGKDAAAGLSWEDIGAAIWNGVTALIDSAGSFLAGLFGLGKDAAVSDVDWDAVGTAIWNGVTGVIDAAGSWLSGLFGVGKDAAANVDWDSVGTAIQTGVGTVLDAAGAWLSSGFEAAKTYVSGINWSEVGTAIKDGVGTVLDTAGTWLSAGFEAAKTAIGQIDWQGVGSTISSGISGAIDGLAKLGGSIWDTITGWFGGDEEQDARGNAQSSGRSLTDGMETGITEGSAAVTAAANTAAAAALGAAAGTLSGDAGSAVTAAWMGGLSSGITDAQETLESDAQAAAEGAQQAAADCLTTDIGKEDGTAYMAGISSGFNGARSALAADAKTVAGEAESAARAVLSYSAGHGIGQNMMYGMAAGVRSGASALYSAITSVASAAVRRAKSTLRINSPSGVFADEVGAWIPGGIGAGVTKNMEDALGPLDEVRRSMVGLFDGALSGVTMGDPQIPWSPQSSGGGPTSVTINITGDWTVRSDEDRDAIINELYERISDETRRR